MNLQEIFFLVCTIGVSVVGTLLTFGEKFLPLWFIDSQIVSYGKLVRKERSKAERFAVPKAWFSHFYIFASSLGWGCLAMAVSVYFYDYQPHRYLLNYLDFFCGKDRTAKTSPFISLLALAPMTLQCTRRLIESNFLQIFSRKGKIALLHYILSYLHYHGVFVAIIGKADGFVDGHRSPEFKFEASEVLLAISTSIFFVYFWWRQFQTNMIFVNLRKSITGAVVTETHLLPKGGLFKYLSSPHMTCELAMYLALYVLLFQNSSFAYICAFVFSNQLYIATATHQWYKDTFSDYPTERKAFIPFIL